MQVPPFPSFSANYLSISNLRKTVYCLYDRIIHNSFINTRMASSVTKEISYEDLKALVGKSQNLFLVDVRSKDDVEKGRIPGSVNIPVDSVEAALAMEPEAFKAKYGVTKPPMDAAEVVFHCNMGGRGARATNTAYKLGYVNARNYVGGYKEWNEKEGK